MGKEFVEYKSENGRFHFGASTLCCCLTQYAKEYITVNRTYTRNVKSVVRDAVLVDSINYLGVVGGLDFALYTMDLYSDGTHDDFVDPNCLLTVFLNFYSRYIFDGNMVQSVLDNSHMNDCEEEFDFSDGAFVLLDFANYIAEKNDIDRKFTMKDFYDRYNYLKHKDDMYTLIKFLELSNYYSDRLACGENINDLYNELAKQYSLKRVTKKGEYIYTDDKKDIYGKVIRGWNKDALEKDLYALAYAYGKSGLLESDKKCKNVILSKIDEMKKR